METNQDKPISIEDLYPEYSSKEQKEAEKNIDDYLNLVWRIFNRVKSEDGLGELKAEREKDNLRKEWEKRSKI